MNVGVGSYAFRMGDASLVVATVVATLGVWRGDDDATAGRRLEPVDPDRELGGAEVLLVAGESQAVAAFLDFARSAIDHGSSTA